MRILVTGGAGFIGSNLTYELLKNNHEVTILDNFLNKIHGSNKNLHSDLKSKVRLIKGDVTDKKTLFDALRNQQAVIHLAAETGTGQSMYEISNYTKVNVLGTSLICDFIINEKNTLETVVVASSRSIYGEGKYKSNKHGIVYPKSRTYKNIFTSFEVKCPISNEYNLKLMATDEDSKIQPSSFYGITKQVQEQMISLACNLKNINSFSLRYQNVYGPGQSLNNPYTGILSIFTRLALKNEEINIFEDGKESRDFVYIDDVVNATYKCLLSNKKGQFILNIGSGIPTSVLEVANKIVLHLNSDSKINVSGVFREGDIRHNYADLNNVKSVLNFNPKWSFHDGIKIFLDWVLSQNSIPKDNLDFKKSINELKLKGFLK